MTKKDPYQIIKHRHITEKATVLQELKNSKSNPCISRCESPKYVFVVDTKATKPQIAEAIEEIYKDKQLHVVAVNTIQVKSKPRRVRGRPGRKSAFKKAIVTFEKGDNLENL